MLDSIRRIVLATTLAWAGEPIPVDASNFVRTEVDLYMSKAVKQGHFGKLGHQREMAPSDW